MTTFLRLIAWGLAAAVTFATLGPPRYRPHADLGQNGEHALAFVLVGLAYRKNRLVTAVVAVALTGTMEILQFWVPGRHARISDFVVDAAAACAGLVLAATLDWIVSRNRTQTS